ncbi:hypothetical protein A3A38_02070 [Candidatus Kaiserbacteria bacterium RIFCSPLOWO2_01_FULL_53_17]|uniref:Riboflavin biosynthesis intermediates N-glycosidase n=1 Tax=Candidatus Kaiserbacteria bacterium RIFCSPLOWO2_01_FULL_53_17 TaxID=1798511 RepID=A0A1F6EFM2_9BACT|nr:MAG: hypothetical protein A3A38_02070 [Candidatus Kaiserbacteria bacterium RIFCSPLOWO2_01_FULL_53_17]
MDIGSKAGYPASALSNFAPHPFVFDGVECASMEGLLQSFKFDKPHIQIEVCKLVGLQAKHRGQKRNKAWKRAQGLWWQGRMYDRHGKEYQELLDRAFNALFKNDSFRKALCATRKSTLTHAIGKSRCSETVLTEREFCSRLEALRAKLQSTE